VLINNLFQRLFHSALHIFSTFTYVTDTLSVYLRI